MYLPGGRSWLVRSWRHRGVDPVPVVTDPAAAVVVVTKASVAKLSVRFALSG